MVSEGRLCCWPPRLCARCPSPVCWRPPSICVVVLLNGGGGVCCDAPPSDWVRHLALSYSLSYCPVPLPPFVFAVTALLV